MWHFQIRNKIQDTKIFYEILFYRSGCPPLSWWFQLKESKQPNSTNCTKPKVVKWWLASKYFHFCIRMFDSELNVTSPAVCDWLLMSQLEEIRSKAIIFYQDETWGCFICDGLDVSSQAYFNAWEIILCALSNDSEIFRRKTTLGKSLVKSTHSIYIAALKTKEKVTQSAFQSM